MDIKNLEKTSSATKCGKYELSLKYGDVLSVDNVQGMHYHVCFEFFFAVSGEINIVTEAGKYEYSGKIVIIPPMFRHYSFVAAKGVYGILVYSAEKLKAKKLFSKLKKDGITVLNLNDEIVYYVKQLNKTETCDRIGKDTAETLIELIFLEAEKLSFASDERSMRGSVVYDKNYADTITTFVINNYKRFGVTVEELAEFMSLSKKQTSRIIKREFGCSFPQLMNEQRLSVASMLLKNSMLSVEEIINELNFETESYFYKVFKKKFGFTPLKYRKSKAVEITLKQ